jgi:hypothetical protein
VGSKGCPYPLLHTLPKLLPIDCYHRKIWGKAHGPSESLKASRQAQVPPEVKATSAVENKSSLGHCWGLDSSLSPRPQETPARKLLPCRTRLGLCLGAKALGQRQEMASGPLKVMVITWHFP